MIFTVFSENFLPEDKLCGCLFRPSQQVCLFLTTCKLSWFSPGQEKSHFFYNHIYITIYIITFPWLCLSMITLSLTHFSCAVIVPDASNNVQTIGTIIWKRYPDDHKWPGWLRRPLSIAWIELSSIRTIGRIV